MPDRSVARLVMVFENQGLVQFVRARFDILFSPWYRFPRLTKTTQIRDIFGWRLALLVLIGTGTNCQRSARYFMDGKLSITVHSGTETSHHGDPPHFPSVSNYTESCGTPSSSERWMDESPLYATQFEMFA